MEISTIVSCMFGLCFLIWIITRMNSYRRGFQDGLNYTGQEKLE